MEEEEEEEEEEEDDINVISGFNAPATGAFIGVRFDFGSPCSLEFLLPLRLVCVSNAIPAEDWPR